MAEKQLSKLKITPNDQDTYVINDIEARTIAQNAQSTAQTAKSTAQTAQSTAQTAQSTAKTAQSAAQSAQSIANSKLKTAKLSSSYDDTSKTLTLSIATTTN